MTASQMVSLYLANQEARRQKALMNPVYTPAVKDAIDRYQKSIAPNFRLPDEWRKQLAEVVPTLPKIEPPKIEIPDSLIEQAAKQFQFQNQELATLIRNAALGSSINFKLPEGYLDAIGGWREQLASEAAEAEEPSVAAERLRRLADEREAIIKCLYRIGLGLEGLAYLPESPLPHFVGFLFLLVAMLGEVADEYISELDD